MEVIEARVVKCQCGYGSCSIYQLNFGTFYQGCGFDKDDAELLARLWNLYHHERPRTLPLSKLTQMWGVLAEAIAVQEKLPQGGTSTELGTVLQKLDLNVLWLLMLQYSPLRDVMEASQAARKSEES